MKRKFLAAMALAVSISAVPLTAYASATVSDSSSVNTESQVNTESETAEVTQAPEQSAVPTETPGGDITPTPSPSVTPEPSVTPPAQDDENSESQDSQYTEGWNQVTGTDGAQHWIYYDAENGGVQQGLLNLNEKTYLTDENGYLQTGAQQYTDEDGTVHNFYFSEEGEKPGTDSDYGVQVTGFAADGKYYAPDLATDQIVESDGAHYYAGEDGTIVKNGFVTVSDEDGDRICYFDRDGRQVEDAGWITVDGLSYYILDGQVCVDGNYASNQDENAKWLVIEGDWFLIDAHDGHRLSGLQKNGNDLYYLDPEQDDKMFTSTNDTDGWKQVDGTWYFFRSWGGALNNGWSKLGIDYYWFHEDGSMASDEWLEDGGNLYYLRDWGGMLYDQWRQDPETTEWYYFRGWGAAFRNEKFTDPADGNIYYGSSDGSVVTDQWVQIGSDWYCFDSQGRAYRNQWFDSSEKPTGSEPAVGFYYVGSDGVMLKDTYLKTQKDGADYYYSFSGTGACNYADPQYVRVRDSVNGLYYVVEHQYYTDPQVSERDLMAAICAAEAGIQRTTGMTAVAMVIRNRMDAYGYSMKTAIYQQQQFEPARNGSLTRYLQGISSGTASTMQELTNAGAYIAADVSETIMNNYKTNGTNRVVPDFGDTREDFDYMYFMTPAAFERLNLDPEKCQTYTYTYTGTTSTGETYTSSHIFFVDWVRKS